MSNRSDKRHEFLSLRDRRRVEKATALAPRIGLPLTMAVTVHWALTRGPCKGEWRDKFGYLMLLCRRWMRDGGVTWAATAVHEQGDSKEMPHTHLAIHVPPKLFNAFEAELKRLLNGYVESVAMAKPIKPPHGATGWARYQTKGVHPRYWDMLHVPQKDRNKPQGPIEGRRIYVARSIGEAAQARYEISLMKPPALTGNAEIDQRIMTKWRERQRHPSAA